MVKRWISSSKSDIGRGITLEVEIQAKRVLVDNSVVHEGLYEIGIGTDG